MEKIKKSELHKYIKYAVRYLAVPLLLEIIIESLSRKSITGGLAYFFDWPSLFVFNTLIIMLTMSVALFFKREVFVYSMVTAVWLIFGIVNFVVLHFRVTPFSAVDITLLESAISVSEHYLNIFNVAMIVLGAVLVVGALVCLFFMAPKHTHRTQKRLVVSGICVALIISALIFIRAHSNSVKALEENYTNIAEAYENYGFVYCFTNSIIDTGISKPEEYDEAHVKDIVDHLSGQTETDSFRPNIIFVQLESFFDVDTLKKLKLSKDAIPNFHMLQERYSNGLLTVPTVGAGTVNTEFEVLTGMSQKDFGTSEYPYKTVLRKKAAESICYNLKHLGYTSHCVHNNEGTFYARNKVYKNLGLDTFTSMEYMNGLEDNPNGWKKDRILTGEIIHSLDSTQGQDFTLAITVQSHGKYEGFQTEENAPIQVEKAPGDKKDAYSYYVNQLYEVDQMIGALVSALSKRKEKTVLVLYGDHLPSLDITKEDLTDSNLYQTQYVIWDNLGWKKKEKNLTSYQLYAEVLERLGIREGIITKYHQNASWRTKTYHENLKMLEYDMLYGENYAYQGDPPFQTVETQMGTDQIMLTDVIKNENGYMLSGTGFTPYCHLLFNGHELSIQWVDSEHIQILEELEQEKEEEEEEASRSETPVSKVSASEAPTSGSEDKSLEPEKKDVPNAFYIQVKSEGGTVLSESEALKYSETTLGKTE